MAPPAGGRIIGCTHPYSLVGPAVSRVVRHQDEGADPAKEVVAFLVKHLRAKD
jgi:glutamate racemase